MPLTVKICGLKDAVAMHAALESGAAYVGVVFYAPSPRHVTTETAATLAAQAKGKAVVTGLFVNPSDEELRRVLKQVPLDLIQLHGQEMPERVIAIRKTFGLPVMKAIGIASAEDFAHVPAYEKVADKLLFDAKQQTGDTRPGGNARAFNWPLLKDKSFAVPWLLAGGLTADNLADAIAASGATGVDVSSGVENAEGKKDPEKIRLFLKTCKDVATQVHKG